MSQSSAAPPKAPRRPKQLSPQQKTARKQQVLTHKKPSHVQGIADAVVIKAEDLFFLCERDGQVPTQGRHGFGLYYHDCRFLNGYELRLAGQRPGLLAATPRQGFNGLLELTGPHLPHSAEKEEVGVRWERVLDGGRCTLLERLTLHNFSQGPVEFPLELAFRAGFEDVFLVRGLMQKKLGKLRAPYWQDHVLHFVYHGTDNLYRSVQISFTPAPSQMDSTTAQFPIRLGPRESQQLEIGLLVRESPHLEDVQSRPPAGSDLEHVLATAEQSTDQWLADQTQIKTSSFYLGAVLDRSLRDLRVLRSNLRDEEFFAAGVPWFATLFGRDSLIAGLQMLAFNPGLAEQTLRLLAQYQGTKVDDWRDEQPGKILHELRTGELAHIGAIPQTPYYGSIDSTPLYLILLGRHAAWTGHLRLFQELRDHVERALEWLDHSGDSDGDGYLEYDSTSAGHGLVNQGWKDSGDGIVNADGSLAQPPIRLVEVQGYAYRARLCVADLFERAGDRDRAGELRRQAEELRERFNRDFWLPEQNFYALALQRDHRPAAVVSSNPGQALWTGIVADERVRTVVDRLLAEDMFDGWGVRTLSANEKRYNPVGYHLGTVWPHDNSIILAGCRACGCDAAALRIFSGITRAAMHLHGYQLPEVFAGFRRDDFGVPVHYPVACHPQAWAAGAVPFMLTSLLGLEPDAFERRLRIVRPILPAEVDGVELNGLRVGEGRLDLRFRRGRDGLAVEVARNEGPVQVQVED